jgi:hypothetical protein
VFVGFKGPCQTSTVLGAHSVKHNGSCDLKVSNGQQDFEENMRIEFLTVKK